MPKAKCLTEELVTGLPSQRELVYKGIRRSGADFIERFVRPNAIMQRCTELRTRKEPHHFALTEDLAYGRVFGKGSQPLVSHSRKIVLPDRRMKRAKLKKSTFSTL